METKKTTYKVDGCTEPCFEVSDGYTLVRIAKFYHYVGHNTILVTEYLDGDFNSQEEMDLDFDSLSLTDAEQIAKKFSVYLN